MLDWEEIMTWRDTTTGPTALPSQTQLPLLELHCIFGQAGAESGKGGRDPVGRQSIWNLWIEPRRAQGHSEHHHFGMDVNVPSTLFES